VDGDALFLGKGSQRQGGVIIQIGNPCDRLSRIVVENQTGQAQPFSRHRLHLAAR